MSKESYEKLLNRIVEACDHLKAVVTETYTETYSNEDYEAKLMALCKVQILAEELDGLDFSKLWIHRRHYFEVDESNCMTVESAKRELTEQELRAISKGKVLDKDDAIFKRIKLNQGWPKA